MEINFKAEDGGEKRFKLDSIMIGESNYVNKYISS